MKIEGGSAQHATRATSIRSSHGPMRARRRMRLSLLVNQSQMRRRAVNTRESITEMDPTNARRRLTLLVMKIEGNPPHKQEEEAVFTVGEGGVRL